MGTAVSSFSHISKDTSPSPALSLTLLCCAKLLDLHFKKALKCKANIILQGQKKRNDQHNQI